MEIRGPLRAFALALAMPSVMLAQKLAPAPISTTDLSSLAPATKSFDGTVAFLTPHTLAVAVCAQKLGCELATFELENGSLRQTALIHQDERPRAIHRAANGDLLLLGIVQDGQRNSLRLNPDLTNPQWLPGMNGVTATGETLIATDPKNKHWAVYKVDQPNVKVAEGQGRAAAFSDQAVVKYASGSPNIPIERFDGTPLGSIATDAPFAIPTIFFLGQNHIWWDGGSHPQILDVSGKLVRKLPKQDGWGFRIGQSTDGTRLLSDRFARHVGLAQTIGEDALLLPTMGMSTDGFIPNTEVVTVVDTDNGKNCFEWTSKTNLLSMGGLHADIDPTGQLVAIMTRNTLSVYRLPDSCSAH